MTWLSKFKVIQRSFEKVLKYQNIHIKYIFFVHYRHIKSLKNCVKVRFNSKLEKIL